MKGAREIIMGLKEVSIKVENDYNNQYLHLEKLPSSYVSNINNSVDGYPKLQRLNQLKQKQIAKHSTKPYGYRVQPNEIAPVLTKWCDEYNLQFDVIMIGAMTNDPFALSLLTKLPLPRLCSKPGFLFIWATREKIGELSMLLNVHFNKKFRRSEELIFLPVSKDSKYYPPQNDSSLFENQQWHCWMCITGTVRRSTDQHLIHCNIDTDLKFEPQTGLANSAVPGSMYRIAENFSNLNRRLHIIPTKLGYDSPIRSRPGWVIMSPDILLHNFEPIKYESDLYAKSFINYKNNLVQYLISQTAEIEELRPKSPTKQEGKK